MKKSSINSLKLEYDAITKEYQIIWDEIKSRVEVQQNIINFALVSMGALIGLSQFYLSTQISNPSSTGKVIDLTIQYYPAISLLFFSFGLMYSSQDSMMYYLGQYTTKVLRPQVEKILSDSRGEQVKIWRWNSYRTSEQFSNIWYQAPLTLAGYLITFGPGIFFSIIF